jgi:hypothetical protein
VGVGVLNNREASARGIGLVALACLAAVGTFVLLAASPATAAWTPYLNVVKQQDVEGPMVEMDPAGDAVFLWMQGFDTPGAGPAIYTRVRMADGSLSPIRRIGSVFGPYDLAVDPNGNAYYVWTDLDASGQEHLRARVRRSDGTLTPVQTLKTVPRGDFVFGTIGVDASGTAVYGWTHRRDSAGDLLQARTRSVSGALGPVHTVGQGDQLDLGVDANGSATFAWRGANDQIGVYTRILAPNGNLSAVKTFSQQGHHGSDPHLVVTPSGRALFQWDEYNSNTDTDNLLIRARSAGGAFQPPQVIAKPYAFQEAAFPRLAAAPTGEAVVTWRSDEKWHARRRAPDGTLGPTKTVTPALVYDSDVALDSHGNAVYAWTIPQGGKTRLFARTQNAAGIFGPTSALSLAGYNAGFADVAMNPAGDAAVSWQAGNSGFAIQASFGP